MRSLLELTEAIAQTPAPTFQEGRRAELLARLFSEGGQSPQVDETGNVFVRLGPEGPAALCLAAHLDSVFSEDPVMTRVQGDWLVGRGVADDAAGLAILVRLAAWARTRPWRRPVFFLADVGEEGLGDLRGIRRFLASHPEVGYFVSLDGRLGSIVHRGIGVTRLRLLVHTEGGHSWGDFGRPSAIHRLVSALDAITRLPLPKEPRTTLNVGVISGGTAVNAIAADASALVDLRSLSSEILHALEEQVTHVFLEIACGPGVQATVERVGTRPAGGIAATHPLVEAARRALRTVGLEARCTAGSTDANAAFACGIPAIAFGIVEARGAHSAQEALFIPSLEQGYRAAEALLRELAWLGNAL